MPNTTATHTCFGAIFCGFDRAQARAECAACQAGATSSRCAIHPAFEADNCPGCGTSTPVGMTTAERQASI